MPAQFVPLGGNAPPPSTAKKGEDVFRLTIISADTTPVTAVAAPDSPSAAAPAPEPAAPIPRPKTVPLAFAPLGNCAGGHSQPQVTVQKDGDRITQIRILCTCGQVIELACQY